MEISIILRVGPNHDEYAISVDDRLTVEQFLDDLIAPDNHGSAIFKSLSVFDNDGDMLPASHASDSSLSCPALHEYPSDSGLVNVKGPLPEI